MNNKGFSLLEVLICMVILAFGLLATAQMQFVAMKGNQFGNKATKATILAHNALEELKNLALMTLSYRRARPPSRSRNRASFIRSRRMSP